MSRIDEYLINCCERCGCEGLPEPISTTDKLLHHLAETLENGGSGGAQSDWNAKEGAAGHVLNRTHYAESVSVELLPECNPTYSENDGVYIASANAVPVVGDICIIQWNGTEYVCTAQDASAVVAGAVGVGNGEKFGLASNGEPFGAIFANNSGTIVAMIIPLDGSTEITIAAYSHSENIHKLDNKYIDAEWMATIVGGKGTAVLEEAEVTFFEVGGDLMHNWYPASGVVPQMDKDKSYIVAIDGKEYSAELQAETSDVIVFSDHEIDAENGNYNGARFLLVVTEESVAMNLLGYDTANLVHTIGIWEDGRRPNRLPEKFLPESVDGVIIRSSTADSTKKFKLTVDDSGAIAATEVT